MADDVYDFSAREGRLRLGTQRDSRGIDCLSTPAKKNGSQGQVANLRHDDLVSDRSLRGGAGDLYMPKQIEKER